MFITVDGDAIVGSPFRLEVKEKRRQPQPSGIIKSLSCIKRSTGILIL